MSIVKLAGAETGDTSELSTVGGGFSASTTYAQGSLGAYSYKLAGNNDTVSVTTTGLNLTRVYYRVYFLLDDASAPASGYFHTLCGMYDSGGTLVANLLIFADAAGGFTLEIRDTTNSAVGSAVITIASATWYRFEFDVTKGAGSGAVQAWQDGVSKISVSSQNFGANNIDQTKFGGNPPTGKNYYFDDIAINDAVLPGSGAVIARQFKAGSPTYGAWTKTGGTNIEDVWNDTPVSAGTYAATSVANSAQTGLLSSFSSTQTGHGSGTIAASDNINGIKAALIAKTVSTVDTIAIVGAIQAASVLNGANVSLTFNVAAKEGDVAYLWGGHFIRASTSIGPVTGGYTQLFLDVATSTQSFGVWRKVMGTTPDVSVIGVGTSNAADSTAYGAILLRGVSNTTPEDVAVSTASGASTNPNCPQVTTVTNNAWTLALAASIVSDSSTTAPTNYVNKVGANSNDTNPCTIAGSTRLIATAGAEDPAAYTGWSSGSWFAATVAVRPATATGFSIRRRFNGTDTDTAKTLTVSDAYYETAIFTDTLTNINASEVGALHGTHSAVQTVEDAWLMVEYMVSAAPANILYSRAPYLPLLGVGL